MFVFLALFVFVLVEGGDINRQSIIFNAKTPNVFYCPQVYITIKNEAKNVQNNYINSFCLVLVFPFSCILLYPCEVVYTDQFKFSN